MLYPRLSASKGPRDCVYGCMTCLIVRLLQFPDAAVPGMQDCRLEYLGALTWLVCVCVCVCV